MRDISVAVIGGGVAGLSVAAWLARAGMACTVFEQAERFTDAGAGIQLSPNATRLLHRLGLAEALDKVAVRPTAIELRRWNSNEVIGRTELGAACEARYGAPYYTLHRADLHRVLMDAAGTEPTAGLVGPRVRLDHQCVGIKEAADGVDIRFADSSRARADVVVGADGIRSTIRAALVEDDARCAGITVYRGLVRARRLARLVADPRVLVWLGPGRHCVCYPISGWVSFVAATPADGWRAETWTAPGCVADVVAAYAGWHDDVLEVLAAADSVTRWALHDRAPLARLSTRRVAVVGDAAHAMLPFGAQGANQAIEDAAALATCLRQATAGRAATATERGAAHPRLADDVALALARYERLRVERLARVSAAVRDRTRNHHLADGQEQQLRDQALTAHESLLSQAWLYGYDAEEAAGGAMHGMERS
jgi:salicylate hydroxylase